MYDIEQIKDSHDIVDIVGQYVDIKKNGKDWFGCCPFHSEKTPSFSVNERDQYYYCFGCGESGNVIDFTMAMGGYDFKEACAVLSGEAASMPNQSEINRVKNNIRKRVTLPLNQNPIEPDSISRFFSMCQVMENPGGDQSIYVYDKSQAVLLTDPFGNPVSAALVKSGFKPRFMGGGFIFGSCVILGDSGTVNLFDDYHRASKAFLSGMTGVVCYFKPNNLPFVYKAIKHKVKSFALHSDCEESKYHADSCGINVIETSNATVLQ